MRPRQLTEAQLNEAIGYNKRQGFTLDEVKFIQGVVGTHQDGLWGPKTVRALYQWQQAHGIPPDGKIWKSLKGNTWPRILEAVQGKDDPLKDVRIGCWIDDRVSVVLKDSFFDKLQELHLSSIALMLDTTKKPWDPQWKHMDIEKIGELAEPRNIELILTTWPYPDKTIIDAMVKDVALWMNIGPVAAFEVDVEFNWKSKYLKGFSTMKEASDYLVPKMREAVEPVGGRIELTTVASHTENSSTAKLAPYMDRLLPQAYSFRNRKVKDEKWEVPWNHRYGPGQMQKETLRRTITVPGVKEGKIEMGCGLAAYDQKWPEHSPEEAMKKAFETAVEHGCREIRYWSSKWIFGHRANGYAEIFLKEKEL